MTKGEKTDSKSLGKRQDDTFKVLGVVQDA